MEQVDGEYKSQMTQFPFIATPSRYRADFSREVERKKK